jgi:hypothetical protein
VTFPRSAPGSSSPISASVLPTDAPEVHRLAGDAEAADTTTADLKHAFDRGGLSYRLRWLAPGAESTL